MNRRAAILVLVAVVALAASADAALAQFARHPFAIGGSEGAVGHQTAFGAWVLAQESRFYLPLTAAVRATRTDPAASLLLLALAFGYGVFHAAGPGHGKAVITTYMVSNEVALRRGLVIAGLAAVVQALVATALIGIAAYVFNATAERMTAGAQMIALAGYLGIIAFGLYLVWRKGRALAAAFRFVPARPSYAMAFDGGATLAAGPGLRAVVPSRFTADDGSHPDDCDCGGSHMPNPALLAGPRLDAKAAISAVLLAGARPCSGALLVLVFAYAQGVFALGVLATFAMAAGTALTTGALATAAVFAKGLALRISGSQRANVTLRVIEFVAALAILLFGVALFGAALAHGA